MELSLAYGEIRLPERLDRAALAALRSSVSGLAGQPVAVLRGAAEGTFCRGLEFDTVTSVDEQERADGLADFEHAALMLVTSATRTIALVDGDAMGGGLGVAAACDVVIASNRARFGLPEPLFGLIPGLVLPLIRSRVGGPALRRLALGAESIDAREARRLGLVDEVVAEELLDTRIVEWVRRLSRAEPGAAKRLKQWLAEMDNLTEEMARGRAHLNELLGSPVVTKRVGRYQRGLAPWLDDD